MFFRWKRKQRALPPWGHLVLLVLFAGGMVVLWMLPALLMGYPFSIPGSLTEARTAMESGTLQGVGSPFLVLILQWLHRGIAWQNLMAWSLTGAAAFALALFPWWFCVRRLFNASVAWCSTVILALMPMFWFEAVRMEGHSFALLFLFLSFWAYLSLHDRWPTLAVAVSGLLFGAVLGVNHAFITFLPWFVLATAWYGRAFWKRTALTIAIFCAATYGALMAPLFPHALLFPLEDHLSGIGHLYPDQYTYEFLKDEFDAQILERGETASFFDAQGDQRMKIIFGVGDVSITSRLFNSVWLFLNSLPPFFLQETIGGVFLWLFILPGIVVLYRQRRQLLLHMVGLWLTMEFILRFVLHFGRDHLMDIGWALALIAGIGITTVAAQLQVHWKKVSPTLLSVLMMVLISMQLVQANRKLFARLYEKSVVPLAYATGQVLQSIPKDSLVAHPRKSDLFFFSDRKNVVLHTPTIQYLAEHRRLREPFGHYGVTHILGYDKEMTNTILTAVPYVRTVDLSATAGSLKVSPLVKYLLHVIR